ncbi:MAG: conjugal transfer protein TrbE [Phenylobacterium sp.]|uniref:conjugal transfer protein TrbE n=1 Tax=Phenylobacterium sp. TaxID=1871053 RepID=UPI002736692D|nr:conjugal transfer protein TrbE [Phenylobacterium sp.]MDP3746664.1 conjugal transfer protein TrbE [Phenylobacterium sp.]
MHLAEYRKRPACLADWLPWAGLVAPGVVLNKDGGFQRSARFRGPDLASASEAELVAVSARLNNALKRLGSGWALFVEAERRPAAPYPAAEFAEPLAWLIDEERRAAFDAAGELFESAYTLTVVYLPPEEARARAGALLFENTEPRQADWRGQLARYVDQTERISDLLEGVLPEFAWLGDGETLTYLHGTVSTRRHPVAVPEAPVYLDALLADAPLVTGLKPKLGAASLRTLTVRGFPAATWPGLLDELNCLAFPYRWVVRFLFLDKAEAERELGRRRRQWFAKRKGVATLLRETLFREESQLVDSDAANKAADADDALQALGSDAVGFGYLTATVSVWDADAEVAEARLREAERMIQARGFVTIPETLNAVEAWLSSIPGQVYANVRTPVVSTLNLAHLMPVSAVWAGPERNAHLDGPPLLITRTEGATPFRLTTHVGDVGHALVVGPTGAGKSVLLALLVLQFRKYADAQISVFDKGGSIRAAVLGLGGAWHDLGDSGGPAFQPLRGIDDPATLAWAAGWVAGLLAQEGVSLEPEVKDAVWRALSSLASAPVEERTLTGLSILMSSARLRQALAPYTVAGPHGRLLDADTERWSLGDLQAFEMEALMRAPGLAAAVLAYLFHRIELSFTGAPGLLVLDEAWVFLDNPLFARRIRDWLKTLRKKNVAVVFATQSLADIQASAIAPSIVESCPTRIFLPAPQALEPQLTPLYAGFGLNPRQIEIVAHARGKRDYYLASPLGNRLFELGLGELALAFAGASTPADHAGMDELVASAPGPAFAPAWLRCRGLAWAAELIDPQPPASEET